MRSKDMIVCKFCEIIITEPCPHGNALYHSSRSLERFEETLQIFYMVYYFMVDKIHSKSDLHVPHQHLLKRQI